MKKYLSILLLISAAMLIVVGCSNKDDVHKDDQYSKDGKVKMIVYGDFKCPYCKKVETKIMPKIEQQYIDKGLVDYQFINMAFLGSDSIIGSRAGHAVQLIAPKHYSDFQKAMYAQQPKSEDNWITEKVVDNQIDTLDITNNKKEQIKKSYKTKNSKAWQAANKDKKLSEERHIETAPTVFIGGEKVEDPYKFKNYKQLIEKYSKK